MNALRRWAPVPAGLLVVMLLSWLVTRTGAPAVVLAPLPSPVRVVDHPIAELSAETSAPLFTPNRSNAPIGAAADQPPPSPPPVVTGIVIGAGRAVALVKSAGGDTKMLHVGDNADGWTVAAIERSRVTFRRGGETRAVDLRFGGPLAGGSTIAAPAVNGLAAAMRLGLPDANIPRGSPLTPSK